MFRQVEGQLNTFKRKLSSEVTLTTHLTNPFIIAWI